MLSRVLLLLNGYTTDTIDRALELLQKTAELDEQRENVYVEISNQLRQLRGYSPSNSKDLYEYFRLVKSFN